ncbi:MAG: multiheme c-type cytochrome, partial [Acidobacteriota bacterium]
FAAGGVTCYSCHQTQYQSAASPNHLSAGFPTTCELCHLSSQTAWSQATFTHATFQLVGLHATQPCAACHVNGIYKGTTNACIGCHKTLYDKTTTPNHVAAGFPTACDACHKATDPSWLVAVFNHATTYPLVGLHATQPCSACHVNNVYKGTSRECVGCHKSTYDKTTNPNHAAAGFPTTCDSCHKPTDPTWQGAIFNHATVYQLVGLHATQPCAACHVNGVYKGTPRDCYGCHKSTYDKTTSPNHAAAGYPTTCDSCHSASATTWAASSFNHAAIYKLVGLHATQPCAACHVNNVYKGTPNTCVGCHKSTYDKTTSPNHAAAGFPTTCDSCHSASAATWSASFSHTAIYPLVGLHATQPCTACHVNSVYKGTPRTCVGCHQSTYDKTTSPNHAAAGFSTACDSCHNASAATWSASFSHPATFQLVGLHATQPCAACHVNNVYKGTPNTCVGCHLTTYNATTNPKHSTAGFPTTCDTCHSASAATWVSSFNHASTFALAGVHATQPCAACHISGVYKGTPRTCVGCHLANYNKTTNPNHTGAGFSTTCDLCHKFSDATWTAYVFNHTWFPITSGRHTGNACTACHNDSSSYKIFTCLTCHAKATTDSHHQGRAGYRYDSAACYSCHPKGTAG